MKIIEQQFSIRYQYPVYFTEHLFDEGNTLLAEVLQANTGAAMEKKALFVLDEGMLAHYPNLQADIHRYIQGVNSVSLASVVIIPGGEEVKNNGRYYDEILTAIHDEKIDRHSFVIAMGGGAVLDLTGYAAAVAHRGIKHIRIPTTVLSQNDSGVGVKNGINYFGKKNFLGTFAPPVAVFNDISFLHTLDERNWRSGIPEAIKVALIKDEGFFNWIEAHSSQLVGRDEKTMAELIYRCAAGHLAHIASGDPFESGSSRPLDFGHWSAHKLEQLSGFSLLHGEAVALGIALDVCYSRGLGWLEEEAAERVLALLGQLRFDLYHPLLEEPELMNGLEEFREHLGGQLTIMLLKGIGKGENIHSIDRGLMKGCIDMLKRKNKNKTAISKTSLS